MMWCIREYMCLRKFFFCDVINRRSRKFVVYRRSLLHSLTSVFYYVQHHQASQKFLFFFTCVHNVKEFCIKIDCDFSSFADYLEKKSNPIYLRLTFIRGKKKTFNDTVTCVSMFWPRQSITFLL